MKTRAPRLSSVAACVALSLVPHAARAVNVLGCSLDPGQNPNNFVNCVNTESANRANNARSEVERTLEKERAASKTLLEQNRTLKGQLDAAQKQAEQAKQAAAKAAEAARTEVRNSVNYAKSNAELAALQVGRTLPFPAVYQCMEQNGAAARITSDAQAFARNPGVAARDMALRFWSVGAKEAAALTPAALLNAAGAANPKQEMERALGTVRRLAAVDPLAQCAQQSLDPAMAQMIASGQELYSTLDEERRRLLEERIRPVIEQAIAQAQNAVIGRLRQNLEKNLAEHERFPSRIELAALDATSDAPPMLLAAQDGGSPKAFLLDVIAIDVEGIASNALVRGILNPRLNRSATSLAAVSALLARSPGPLTQAQRDSTIAAVRQALRTDPRIRAEVEIEIVMGIVKSMGSNYINSSEYLFGFPGGAKLADLGMLAMESLVEYVFRIATEAGGTINVVGSVISIVESVYKGIDQSVAADIAKAAIKKGITLAADALYTRFIDDTIVRLKAGEAASIDATLDDMRRTLPAFSAVFDFLQSKLIRKLAAGYITDLEQRLDAYQAQVDTLTVRAISR